MMERMMADQVELMAEMKASLQVKAKVEARQEEAAASLKEFKEDVKGNIEAAINSVRSDFKQIFQRRMVYILSCVEEMRRSLHTELTEMIEKTQVELQSVEESLDRETKDLREELTTLKSGLFH
jgi:hypothetical protein